MNSQRTIEPHDHAAGPIRFSPDNLFPRSLLVRVSPTASITMVFRGPWHFLSHPCTISAERQERLFEIHDLVAAGKCAFWPTATAVVIMLLMLTNEPCSCTLPGWNLMSADGMKRSYSTDKTLDGYVSALKAVEKDQPATPSELNRSRNSSRLGATVTGFSRPSGNRSLCRGLLSLHIVSY